MRGRRKENGVRKKKKKVERVRERRKKKDKNKGNGKRDERKTVCERIGKKKGNRNGKVK